MGVLNFPGSFCSQNGIDFDILSLEAEIDLQYDWNEEALQNLNISQSDSNRTNNKRKRVKGSVNTKKSYDFRDYGVDARRRGAKHQRRKQNLADLMVIADSNDDVCEVDNWYSDDHFTLFTELFLDEKKMKAWECFVNMPEEKQKEYLEEKTGVNQSVLSETTPAESRDVSLQNEEDTGFHMIDRKIQDMLRTKKMAALGLLEYYEDDVRFCAEEENFPSVLVLDLNSSYDRLLVYAICQYMKLSSNTIRLKDTSLIEIELPSPHDGWRIPQIKLTDYLKRMRK